VTDFKDDLASLKIDRSQPQRSPWRWPLIFLIPLALGLATLYFVRIRAALAAVEVQTVQATSVAPGQKTAAGAPILTASGYVVARRKAVVSAKIQGRLAELRVEEGTRVREGETIARLESADFEAQILRAQAQVQRAEADLAENRRQLRLSAELTRDKVLAQDQLEAAESRVKIAEAALRQAQADVKIYEALYQNTVIRAPFTGVVVKKMAEVGESVAPIPPGVNISTASGAIVALADLDTLEVEADVSESNVAKLAAAQPAQVTVEAFPDRQYRAVLRQVIPTADRTKATVQVKVTILDKDKDLKPEMSAKVTFLEPERPATAAGQAALPKTVLVPKAAVATREGKSVVFEVQAGRARLRDVALGSERDGQVVVREGLAGSEILVSRPPETLKDGDAVKVKG
jgi:RND family efflux transporter MFP subunit